MKSNMTHKYAASYENELCHSTSGNEAIHDLGDGGFKCVKSSGAQPAMRLIYAVRFVKQQCSDPKSLRVNWPKALQSCALFFS
jgi:hypothetical protein